jgi:hypothetical protein
VKPFNLHAAKSGDPLVTRGGRVVTEFIHFETDKGKYPCCAIIDGERYSFSLDGREFEGSQSVKDLMMAPKVRTVYLNVYASRYNTDRGQDPGNFARTFDSQATALDNAHKDSAIAIVKALPVEIQE